MNTSNRKEVKGVSRVEAGDLIESQNTHMTHL